MRFWIRWAIGVVALIGIPTVWMLDAPAPCELECGSSPAIAGGPLSWAVTAVLLAAVAWAVFSERRDS